MTKKGFSDFFLTLALLRVKNIANFCLYSERIQIETPVEMYCSSVAFDKRLVNTWELKMQVTKNLDAL